MADIYSSEKRSEIMSRVRGRDTLPERLVRVALDQLGIGYQIGCANLPGHPDIVIAEKRIAIFVHGCFWHGHDCPRGRSKPKTNFEFWKNKIERNRERDQENIRNLQANGWREAVVWECEAKRKGTLLIKLHQEILA